MLQSLHLLYAHSCMLLYAHKSLYNMKVMAVEEVLWCLFNPVLDFSYGFS